MVRSLQPALFVFLAAVTLTGCSEDLVAGDAPDGDSDVVSALPADIASSKTIKVMTDPTYAPLESVDSSGQMVGSDIDLMEAIADEMGVKVEWSRGTFDGIIPGLEAGRFDASIAGMYITEDKYASVNMVEYAQDVDQILVRSDFEGPEFSTEESLCGYTLAIQSGATEIPALTRASTRCEEDGKPGIDLKQFKSSNDGLLAVASGRADAVLVGSISANYVLDETEADLVVHGGLPTSYLMGITVPKESTELADAFSVALQNLKDDGTYDEILAKWKLSDSAVDQFPVNPDVEE